MEPRGHNLKRTLDVLEYKIKSKKRFLTYLIFFNVVGGDLLKKCLELLIKFFLPQGFMSTLG